MIIVDLHHYRGPFFYCGRRIPFHRTLDAVRVDSPLKNPYSAKRHGDRALEKFRCNLHWMIERKVPAVMTALRSLTDESILGCWCVDLKGEAIFSEPERCHCQIIAKAWRWLQQKEAT